MNEEQIFAIVIKHTLSVLPGLSEEQISIDGQLKNLGANSMDRMDIVIATMEEVGVKVPLLELAKASNIRELVNLLADKKLA